MRARISPLSLAAASLCAAQIAGAQAAPAPAPVTLHLGDAAPKLTIAKWIKGTPQTDLADGKVRVVEFWATWCGPCKVGMPHLSDLAKRHKGKVEFVGVDASERVDDVAKAETFVTQSGPMMGYNVAYATPKGAMTQDWMRAAGQNGIPCAFVVDKHGKIGWIGHPLMGLEEAVDLALADKLDAPAAAGISKAWEARMAKGQEDYKAMILAQKDGKTEEALRLNDLLFTELPYMDPTLVTTKYSLLNAKDPKAARSYAETLLRDRANAPMVLQSVASAAVKEGKETVDYKLAQAMLEKSWECKESDPSSVQTMARVLFLSGDKDGAIKRQQEALKMMDGVAGAERMRTMAEKALAEYQAGR